MSEGEFTILNNSLVALFTPTSVDCAERIIATNKVNSFIKDNSVFGSGLSFDRIVKI